MAATQGMKDEGERTMTAFLRAHFLILSLFLAGAAVTVAGCTGDSHTIGEDDGGTTADGGPGGGEACGPVTCGEGLECCNASCGVCTAPGVDCTAIACVDAGPGPCVGCAPPPDGCRYEGGSCESCGTLVCDEVCGIRGGVRCDDSEYCDYDDGCGFDDGGGVCKPRPEGCTEDCPGVCGCDGHTYCNACIAASAGVDVLHDGACDAGPCSAQDARGSGPCAAFFGYAWNGTDCMGLSGCDCVGSDCDEAFDTMEACRAAYDECIGDTCGTEAGLTCGGDEWCDYPDGSYCGGDDSAGTCRPRPTACHFLYDPVCGCDGTTYGNECEAQAAGVDVQYVGECESPPPSG